VATPRQGEESPDNKAAERAGVETKPPPSQQGHSAPGAPRITIADEAVEHLAILAKQGGIEPEHVVLIGVKEGGDTVFKNGGDTRYKHTLAATDDPIDWDTHFLVESNGAKIGIRKDISHFLDGLTVSLAHVDEGIRLRFDNPNAVRAITSARPSGQDESTPTPATLEPIPQFHDSPKPGRPKDKDANRTSVLRNPRKSD